MSKQKKNNRKTHFYCKYSRKYAPYCMPLYQYESYSGIIPDFLLSSDFTKTTCKNCLKKMGIKGLSFGITATKSQGYLTVGGKTHALPINSFEFKHENGIGFENLEGEKIVFQPPPPVQIVIELTKEQAEEWQSFFYALPLKP